jgi:heterodisulfide reductase subunit C
MSINDLTSMAEPQTEIRKEINERLKKLQDEISDCCYQCAKCTSGCEAHKLLELEPHKIIALLKRGLIDEMKNSEIIWTCMACLKCKERCPQRVAPIDVLIALKNYAVAGGTEVPGKYTDMLQSVLSLGLIQEPQETTAADGSVQNRETLGLPPISRPADVNNLMTALSTIAIEKV